MSTPTTTNWLPAKSWQHFLAGGYAHTHVHTHFHIVFLIKSVPNLFFSLRSLGGMCGAVVTSPFDVVKTRLQSDLFRQKHAGVGAVVGDSVVLVRRPGGFLWHFVETTHIIRFAPHSSSAPLCRTLIYALLPLRIKRFIH
jgi:solute carrier family 25 protein 33/36